MKKLCMTELLGGRTLEQLRPIRREETERFLRAVWEKAEKTEEVDLGGELMRLTNNVITRMTLGRRCSESDEAVTGDVRELVKELNRLGGKGNLSDLFWFFKGLDFSGFWKKLKIARDRFVFILFILQFIFKIILNFRF